MISNSETTIEEYKKSLLLTISNLQNAFRDTGNDEQADTCEIIAYIVRNF